MSSIFQNILSWLLLYKYPALLLVSFSSSIGIPLPAASSLIASAAFASQGYLNIGLVLAIGLMGNILGDFTAYALVRRFGKPILSWFHLGNVIESQILKKVEKVENTYRATVITASRFQDQATTAVNIIAGLGGMKFRRFALYAIFGDILQILFYGSIGYFFADNWEALYSTIGIFSWVIILGTTVITILASHRLAKWILK